MCNCKVAKDNSSMMKIDKKSKVSNFGYNSVVVEVNALLVRYIKYSNGKLNNLKSKIKTYLNNLLECAHTNIGLVQISKYRKRRLKNDSVFYSSKEILLNYDKSNCTHKSINIHFKSKYDLYEISNIFDDRLWNKVLYCSSLIFVANSALGI